MLKVHLQTSSVLGVVGLFCTNSTFMWLKFSSAHVGLDLIAQEHLLNLHLLPLNVYLSQNNCPLTNSSNRLLDLRVCLFVYVYKNVLKQVVPPPGALMQEPMQAPT